MSKNNALNDQVFINPSNQNSNRIVYIDVLKFIAIYFVFVGHLGQTFLNTYIWTFHMPLFFFISGMVHKDSTKPFHEFILHKFKTYIIPYFIFALLSTIVFVLDKNKSVLRAPISLENILSYCSDFAIGARNKLPFAGSLWFLPALFLISVFFDALNRLSSRLSQKGKICVLLLVVYLPHILFFYFVPPAKKNFWSWNWAAYHCIYYCLGFLFSILYKKLRNLSPMQSKIFLLILFIPLAAYACTFCFGKYNPLHFLQTISFCGKFFKILYLHLSALCLIFFTVYIAHFLSPIRLFSLVGQNTLYMCGNEYILKRLFPILLNMIGLKLSVRSSMDMYLYAFLLLLLCHFLLVPLQKGVVEKLQLFFYEFYILFKTRFTKGNA